MEYNNLILENRKKIGDINPQPFFELKRIGWANLYNLLFFWEPRGGDENASNICKANSK